MSKLKRYLALLLTAATAVNLFSVQILAAELSASVDAEPADPPTSWVNSAPEPQEETVLPEAVSPSETPAGLAEPSTPVALAVNPFNSPSLDQIAQADALAADHGIIDDFATYFLAVLIANGIAPENSGTLLIEENDAQITLTVPSSQPKILELLSWQDQTADRNYQNWKIAFPDATGTLTLSENYNGLGSAAFPFQGEFTGQSITIATPKTLFKALSASAVLHNNKISWSGLEVAPILADKLVAEVDAGATRTLDMPLASAATYSPYVGTLAAPDGASAVGTVILPLLDYSSTKNAPTKSMAAHLGLLCCTMEANTKLQVNGLNLNSGSTISFYPTNANESNYTPPTNAGGLIGQMGEGSELIIAQPISIQVSVKGTYTGGLVGTMTNASIRFLDGASVSVGAEMLNDTNSAGGIAGQVITTTGPIIPAQASSASLGLLSDPFPLLVSLAGNDEDTAVLLAEPVTEPVILKDITMAGSVNSGILYGICTASGTLEPLKGICFDGSVRKLSGAGSCGGLFGTLNLTGAGECTLSGLTNINSTLFTPSSTTAYGGLAGTLNGDTTSNALVVGDCEITSAVVVNTGNNEVPPGLLGGIVAKQNTATVDAKNSSIRVQDPKTRDADNCGFGGLVANVGDGALLIADTIKVKTTNFQGNVRGGGVAGMTGKGSIVYLKTSLDLLECPLTTNSTSGQIVANQNCSLVYAPGVKISRLNCTVGGTSYKGMELDDIGNYGELYRIPDFLTVNPDYTYTLPELSANTQGEYELSSAEDYACLALAWQSQGNFSTVSGTWSNLKNCTITLAKDLDLTGCGIGGLTRDNGTEASDTFSGTLKGNGRTITLDIGAENQDAANKVSKGDGRIYWHKSTGLFAVLSNEAHVENLKLAGSVRISNYRLGATRTADLPNGMKSGALAAYVTGTNSDPDKKMIDNVSTIVSYDVIAHGGQILCVGGLIGLLDATSAQTNLSFPSGSSLAAAITLTNADDGKCNHVGGVIGCATGSASFSMALDGATLSGKIEYKNNAYNLYAGGLVGTANPYTNGNRSITIQNLTVSDFHMTGKAKDRMGGILAGILSDTDVTIAQLTVPSSTLQNTYTSKSAKIGGLAYRASGKWKIDKIDLGGLTITADAGSLGLLVCQGDPHRVLLNDGYTDTNGLYLEMTQHWDTYQVPAVTSAPANVFDEFVAYTAYADPSSDTPSYQINHNGSGIISLATDDGAVHMDSGERNTYVNRTSIGLSQQINPNSRYYYNLSSILKEVEKSAPATGNQIDTPEELLLWSVYLYAASTLKKHFAFPNVETSTIGGTSDKPVDFDMKGFSYYPIDIADSSVTLQYADVTFYNADIEGLEKGAPENKSTRGNDEAHSQHYTMHCGLFRNFYAEKFTKTIEYAMKVNGVSFAGTVGKFNGGSGALICGTMNGKKLGNYIAICSVILADEDDSSQAVSLNGISVQSNGSTDADYTPVLINKVDSYSKLSAKHILSDPQQKGTQAGSSLIGDVGNQSASATNITVAFSGTIKLPEQKPGTEGSIFSKATLLNSLRYESGSATYTFNQDKDYQDGKYVHNATHGYELGVSVEYDGKHGKYNDTGYVSKNGNFDDRNTFPDDLPYVAHSPLSDSFPLVDKWHELAVNIHSPDLLNGCGTYGHPYQVNADQLEAVAKFINSEDDLSNGWQVRIPVDAAASDSTYHSAEDPAFDTLVTYTDGKWDGENKTDAIREHLKSAYYQLSSDGNTVIELINFPGIGQENYPFTGVITGKKTATENYTIQLTGGSSAFIKYGAGCVMRDLNVELSQTFHPEWQAPSTNSSGNHDAQVAPQAFFGGVIGCVLGGDNIIANVTVKKNSDANVTPTGTGSHLVPIGGYVGVIAGGGVIFRGTYSNDTGFGTTTSSLLSRIPLLNLLADDPLNLYQNPIIGRVLGGYAFYEDYSAEQNVPAPNNGDRNYTINKIDRNTAPNLSWADPVSPDVSPTLTVNNAQGLLILSGIISSGAGNYQRSAAYGSNTLVRHGAYARIGAAEKPDDYAFALESGTPYLLHKYAGFDQVICNRRNSDKDKSENTDGIHIRFKAGGSFDLSGYGNGYRGLSARYASNAAFTSSSGVEPANVVLRMNTFDGNNVTVSNINMIVQEYEDDDFHAASLGGIFNIVWTKQNSGGSNTANTPSNHVLAQNLTLQGCSVSLEYMGTSGNSKVQADTATFTDSDGLSAVAVGGFIGSVSDIDGTKSTKTHNYLFSNLHIQGTPADKEAGTPAVPCVIKGPNSAGGLVGASGMTNSSVAGFPGKLLSNGNQTYFGASFLNCSYRNIAVTAKLAAGGLAGYVFATTSGAPNFSSFGIPYSEKFYCFASCTVTKQDFTVGQDSTICAEAKTGVAGGIFGGAGMRVGVNHPTVNSETGLNIVQSNNFQPVSLSNVTIQACQRDEAPTRSNGLINGPDSGSNIDKPSINSAIGGAIGRIGHVNPTYFYDVQLKNCEISSDTSLESNAKYSGGIVGYGYTNSTMCVQRCSVVDANIVGQYAGGLVALGQSGTTSYKLHLSDCKVEGGSIHSSGYSGGIVGSLNGTCNMFNVLVKNTKITGGKDKTGLLFGAFNSSAVNAAGISVCYDDRSLDDSEIPKKDMGDKATTYDYPGYIIYADYRGKEVKAVGEMSPYVTVNPKYPVWDGSTERYLTGDAVGWLDEQKTSVAKQIWADNKTASTTRLNRVPYARIAETVKKTPPTISSFWDIQKCGPSDLPVLELKNSNASVIGDYLDVITNGGYSKAKSYNSTDVTAFQLKDLTVYHYYEESGQFQKDSSASPTIYKDHNGNLAVNNRFFDNTRQQFTLVEVSFQVKVDGVTRTYTVSVPVIVTRELQYNYMATFYYGAEFNDSTFSRLRAHVLESTGNPFTAYLTYLYGQTPETEYSWQNYMNDGGTMLDINKVLTFTVPFPAGTQMTLVDCQNHNLAYQYTVTAADASSSIRQNIYLKNFTSVSNSVSNPGTRFSISMADVLGVTVEETESGAFVETDRSHATVQRNGVYYRTYQDGDTGQRVDLTVPDLTKVTPKENYYLVITVPDQGDDFFINGELRSDSLDWEVLDKDDSKIQMPSTGKKLHRSDSTLDNGNGTESSYNISTGYRQALVSNSASEAIDMNLDTSTMRVNLTDTITFSNQQAYGESDHLYLKLTTTLHQFTKKEDDTTPFEEELFSAGIHGTAFFYVQDSSGQYYAPDPSAPSGWKVVGRRDMVGNLYMKDASAESGWQPIGEAEKSQLAISKDGYGWASQGSDMELLLSQDGKTALDLSGIRTIIRGSQLTGDSQIIVSAEMEVQLDTQELINVTVPASENNGVDHWVQLHYMAQLATQEASLEYSASRTAADDHAKYYRNVTYQAVLSMDAVSINQLGINPLELVSDYLTTVNDKKASRIDLIATLNLADLPEFEERLAETARLDFTLSLKQRGDNYATGIDPSQRIAFQWPDGSSALSWSVSGEDCSDGKLINSEFFDGTQFVIPLTAFVFTDQKDFANYKIELRVQFKGTTIDPIVPLNQDDAYVIYTFACIKPSFYDPGKQKNSAT